MARGPGSAGGVASCPSRDMSSVSTRRWTCPSQPSKPAGHVPRPRPALDMSLGGPKSRRACASARARDGTCPLKGSISAGQVARRGPALDMSLEGLKSGWTCPSARARDGHIGIMSVARDQHWACPAEGTGSLRTPGKARSTERVNPAAHVRPRGPTLDMSLPGLKSRWTCPSA